jgi:serine/threonine-protein kinase
VVLPVGTLVGGRYRVEDVIGEGSQSVVYRARREGGTDPVALKVIHRHLCGDPQITRRFAREATILGRLLEGEHVARLLDVVEDQGLLGIALELVPGRSLEAMLAERGPLDLDVAIEITLQVCAALGAAHASGIVHRDLKTANVLVEEGDLRESPSRAAVDVRGSAGTSPATPRAPAGAIRIKVVDFGLGKALHGDSVTALTQQGMIFGTPEYMAPEQARGDDVDARADLYAAGVMLYEMLVGAPPFSGRGALATMTAHLQEAPPSPRAARPGSSITPAVEKVILRALAKSPDDRFASARELAQAIAAARDEPLVIAPRAVSDPDVIGTSDTDLHLAPPSARPAISRAAVSTGEGDSISRARTLRADEVAAVQALEASVSPPSALPATQPSTLDATLRTPRPARVVEILDEPTAVSGEPPRRGALVWVLVAVVAAALGVVIGVVVGTR